MARIAELQHFWCEDSGLFGEALRAEGHQVTSVRLFEGHAVPNPDDFDAWLVMGGPMNVDQIELHPYLKPERELLAGLIRRDQPVMGICLGAQLLARSAGAAVYARRPKEIGLFQVDLTLAASHDPLFRELPSPMEVFQWHGDTFDLPAGAVPLARSVRFPNQAFRLGRRVYAIQFHVEVSLNVVDQWTHVWAKELTELAPEDDFEQHRPRLPQSLADQAGLARRIIGRWSSLFGEISES